MTGDTAILYDYWRSSSAYRVRIALDLIGQAYESRSVDLIENEQMAAANLARNPQGLVPTLEIDGLVLTQSVAILEYLNETRGAGLLPDDPGARARVRALAMAVGAEIQPVCNLRVVRHVVAESEGRIHTEDWMRHFINLGLSGLESMLNSQADGRFCHGDTVTLADIYLMPQVYNARRWGVDLTTLPRICAIIEGLELIPAFADAHPDVAKARSMLGAGQH